MCIQRLLSPSSNLQPLMREGRLMLAACLQEQMPPSYDTTESGSTAQCMLI